MKIIGFIGCGNMGSPIIAAVAEKGVFPREDIYVYDANEAVLTKVCAELGVGKAQSENMIASMCDIVFLCIKPQIFPTVLPLIADSLSVKRPLIVSIAAGKTTDYIASFLQYEARIARVFPNLNARVGSAVSAFCTNAYATGADSELVEKICLSFGDAIGLPEDKFSVFGVLGGCAPAYTFMFIDALEAAGRENGLDEKTAHRVACSVVSGSAKLLSVCDEEPEEMVRRVCSPGGTTIEGVTSLREDNFKDIVKTAFGKSLARDKSV